uniref:Uncharacterized protein n=1 Tax=biofilter metagenome TaxID=1070537 RepID=A0A1A7GCA5_9ZZZZ
MGRAKNLAGGKLNSRALKPNPLESNSPFSGAFSLEEKLTAQQTGCEYLVSYIIRSLA